MGAAAKVSSSHAIEEGSATMKVGFTHDVEEADSFDTQAEALEHLSTALKVMGATDIRPLYYKGEHVGYRFTNEKGPQAAAIERVTEDGTTERVPREELVERPN